jgi:hypothetical protein
MNRLKLILLLCIPLSLWGQEQTEVKEKTFGVGLVPQYAITSGTRIDLDFRLPAPRQWLVVAPQFYISDNNSNMWNFNEMAGFGIDLQHRIYLGKTDIPRGAYFAWGPVFHWVSVKDQGLAAYNFKEGDVTYIGLNEEMIHTNIYKMGGNLIFGYQPLLDGVFYLDFYLGTGIRFSFDNRKSGLHSYYNDWWGDLGYSGTLLVGGVRFGVFF